MGKAVVFDMDGVLFDTERLCMDSWVAVAAERGIPDMEKVFPLCIGRNMTDSEQIIRDRYGEDFPYEHFRREASQWFWREIEEHGQPMKPGVEELLSYLRENGWRIGLASSTNRASVLKHLEKAGIREFFSEVIGGDQILHSKPEPDIYLLACSRLGVEPKETYAIEDSYNGIRSANRAGMRPVMVPDMLPPTKEMEELCCAIFENLLQVKEYLSERDGKNTGERNV